MTIRVVIADDQPLLRSGLRGIITTAGDMTVVGEAGTGREAVPQLLPAQRHRPGRAPAGASRRGRSHRGAAAHQLQHGEDAHRPPADETLRARPYPARAP